MVDLSALDIVFCGIITLSFIWGLFRGFIHQVLSLFFLILGYFLARHFAIDFVPTSHGSLIDSAYYVISFSGIFAVVTLCGMVINFVISRIIRALNATFFGMLDKILGGIFGFVRGIIIVMVMVFILQFTPFGKTTYWIDSTLVPYFQTANKVIMDLLGENSKTPALPKLPVNLSKLWSKDFLSSL